MEQYIAWHFGEVFGAMRGEILEEARRRTIPVERTNKQNGAQGSARWEPKANGTLRSCGVVQCPEEKSYLSAIPKRNVQSW